MELLNADDVGTVITVVGARGGIGKSTVATNLAAAIASSADRSVLVMDMGTDTGYGNVALMLNVKPRTTITEIAAYSDLTESTLHAGLQRHESGAFVLGAPDGPGPWARVTATQIQELLQFSARFFDYVIVDTSGIFTDIVAAAMGVADRVIVVNSLDMASTKQTSQMFELLETEQFDSERLYLGVNQVNTAITIRPEDVQRHRGTARLLDNPVRPGSPSLPLRRTAGGTRASRVQRCPAAPRLSATRHSQRGR